MTALIDADVVVYRAIAVMSAEVDWDGGGEAPLLNFPGACQVADELIETWVKMSKQKKFMLIFTDRTHSHASFRHLVHPHYKANRGGEKPAMHDMMHNYLFDKYPAYFMKDLEGDDMMGIMATDDSKYVMVSIDKDMLTLPAKLVNPMDPDPKVRKISLREANYNWMYQTIVGDQVDNFKGAPGAGPKAAEAALAGITAFGKLWNAAMEVFVTQSAKPSQCEKFVTWDGERAWGFTEFLLNARCARILRHGDYDKKSHRVKLWHPFPEKSVWIDPKYTPPEEEIVNAADTQDGREVPAVA